MYVLTALQANEIFEYINLGLSILISILILVLNIIGWFKKAAKDGEIDESEIDELEEILKNGQDNLKDKGDKNV